MGVEGTACPGYNCGCGSCGLWGFLERRPGTREGVVEEQQAPNGEEMLKDRETPVLKETADLVPWLSRRSHVFFHGTYDVELAGSGVSGGKPCGYGAFADAL